MTSEEEVRQASDQFYAALNSVFAGDIAPMEDIWSHGPDVMTMHPLGGRQLGWEKVRESWEQVAGAISSGQVTATGLRISVLGDVAFTICVERGQVEVGGETIEINIRATGIYRRENGQWKKVFHHSDIDPALQEAIERRQVA
ncbi:MAG: nuclear transport factor 2 family protein [Actinomycetota bacterium]|nr:nuclear transport factor 2 family protein [Actinomycetota bacterium]